MKLKTWSMIALAGTSLTLAPGCVVYRDRPVPVTVSSEVPEAPPTPQVEVVPVAPGPEYVWVGGAWSWHGRWIWAPGSWVMRPHVHAVWVGGHWGHGRRGWVWFPGRWR